jgi:hypothetical protein
VNTRETPTLFAAICNIFNWGISIGADEYSRKLHDWRKPAMPEPPYHAATFGVVPANPACQQGGVCSGCRIFLLSPANASGIKGQRLLASTPQSDLGVRLRGSGAQLGEVYRFISSLYFRGKLEYAQRFQNPPRGVAGVQIITGVGLMLPETVVTLNQLQKISATSIDAKNESYRRALDGDLVQLRERIESDVDIILLGSIATAKYIAPIQAVFGKRLLFPRDFQGLGDMSRGSMLLRSCGQGAELQYVAAEAIPDL